MSANNEIVLYGSVGFDWWGDEYFTAKQVREKLAQMSGDITVRINSGGGIASEGQAIYTMLVDYPGKVTVIVDGVAASAASLISMAGDEIVYRLGAWTLIHDPATPWTLGRGTEEDHRKEAELLGVISNAYADIYAARSGRSREECRELMKAETVLDGVMAVELGFATAVDSAAQAVPEAAFDYRIYAHAPDRLRQASRKLGRAPAEEAVMAMIAGRARVLTPLNQKEPLMGKESQTPAEATSAETTETATATAVEAEETEVAAETVTAAQAVQAATARARRITEAVAVAGLPTAFAADLIGAGESIEACLDKINAKWKEEGDMDTPMHGRPTARILRDERDTVREGMEGAIAAQMSRAKTVDDKARPYMDLSLAEMAAASAGLKGSLRTASDRLRAFEIAMATHSTSDFPVIFENALNKRLLEGYLKLEPTYRAVAMRADFNDFRPHPISRVGDWPNLLEVPEGGEIQFGTVGEKKETVFLRPYARALSITRQMLINDDMAAIERIVAGRGQAVAAFEDSTFWAMFLSGTLADGPTLTETGRQVFNTNAADLTKAGTATAITVAALAAGRAALRKKKSLDGQDLNLYPRILLVGPDKETEAQQLLSPIQAQQAGNVNPFPSESIQIVVTPKILDNAWYLLADPSVLPNFMYGFLSGDEGPRFRMDEPFGVQGVRFSVERDFGVGAIDFRGGWKNPGA